MKKTGLLYILILVLFCGCMKEELEYTVVSFEIDGVKYSASGAYNNEFLYNTGQYNKNTGEQYMYYFVMNLYSDAFDIMFDLKDYSVGKESEFTVPDNFPIFRIAFYSEKKYYLAESGTLTIERVNDVPYEESSDYRKSIAKGTFDVIMVNQNDLLDTIHVTNGRFESTVDYVWSYNTVE
ncbi:MAG: hypothetical protein LBB53_03045 [Prevotellaceae bacterium]|jgi:hypothetical protein|nr:hypothetical protein [Prevotellaceae bacterium]